MTLREEVVLKLGREPAMLLVSPTVVLLQIAHPAVANGANDFSDYTKDTLGRFLRTADFRMTQLFGTDEEKTRWVERLSQMHAQVRGVYSGNKQYSARDPDLLAWVHNAMIFSEIRGYEHLIGGLTIAEKDIYVNASLATARLMQIPEDLTPISYRLLTSYIYKKVNTREVRVTPQARRIMRSLFAPFPNILMPLNMIFRHFFEVISAGLLPSEVSYGYKFSYGAREQAEFMFLTNAMKLGTFMVPVAIRQFANPWAQIYWLRKEYHR